MKLYHISVHHLRRRKARGAFLVAALSVGVATVVALISIVQAMRRDVAKKLDEFGANLVIVPRTPGLSLSYGGMTVASTAFDVRELRESEVERIRTIPNAESISLIAPKLVGAVEVQGRQALLVGVDFEEELRLKKWWSVREKPSIVNRQSSIVDSTNDELRMTNDEFRFTAPSPPHPVGGTMGWGDGALLVGSEASEKLGLRVGDAVAVQGTAFTVKGVLEETGSQDDGLLFADLRAVQRLLRKEGLVSMAEVAALCNTCPIEEIVRQISEVLPGAKVTALKQAVQSRMEALHGFERLSMAVAGVVLFIGALTVFIALMGSVNERTREIGVFRAVGFRRSHVLTVILTEALIVSAVGGLLGYAAGYGLSLLVAPMVSGTVDLTIPFDPALAAGAVGLALVVGLIAGIYPAVHAARLDPTAALRAL